MRLNLWGGGWDLHCFQVRMQICHVNIKWAKDSHQNKWEKWVILLVYFWLEGFLSFYTCVYTVCVCSSFRMSCADKQKMKNVYLGTWPNWLATSDVDNIKRWQQPWYKNSLPRQEWRGQNLNVLLPPNGQLHLYSWVCHWRSSSI